MNLIPANLIPKNDILYKYSNPIEAQINTHNYLGNDTILYKSTNPKKKYMIFDYNNNKWIYFGSLNPPYEDYLKHKNNIRKMNYIKRASHIPGNWKNNLYSSNNLSINILWR